MSNWRSKRKIVTMPIQGALTAENVLARTLEKARDGHIKAVVIGIVWDDDSVSSDYSNIGMGEALFALRTCHHDLDRFVFDPDRAKDHEYEEDI